MFYGTVHHVEFGAGQTVSSIVHVGLCLQAERQNNFNGVAIIGYRYQKNLGGFMFRLTYSPIIEKNKFFRHWGGISVGYVF